MALTGHLSDLSLSELIEFFCNQRKSGRLKVLYPQGAGYFYLQAGSVVDARIGVLHGIDAVYYALTLPNAQFEFSVDVEAKRKFACAAIMSAVAVPWKSFRRLVTDATGSTASGTKFSPPITVPGSAVVANAVPLSIKATTTLLPIEPAACRSAALFSELL